MADDWRPSNHKPRGGWCALPPGWRGDLSFNLMKVGVAIVAMAIVAPHLFSGKPPPRPGEFPTERSDERVRAVDDKAP